VNHPKQQASPRTFLSSGVQLELLFMSEPEQLGLPFPIDANEQSSDPPGKPVPEKYDGG
jgi:hypothetical protein